MKFWVQRLNNPQPSHHVAGKDVPKIRCLWKWGHPIFNGENGKKASNLGVSCLRRKIINGWIAQVNNRHWEVYILFIINQLARIRDMLVLQSDVLIVSGSCWLPSGNLTAMGNLPIHRLDYWRFSPHWLNWEVLVHILQGEGLNGQHKPLKYELALQSLRHQTSIQTSLFQKVSAKSEQRNQDLSQLIWEDAKDQIL